MASSSSSKSNKMVLLCYTCILVATVKDTLSLKMIGLTVPPHTETGKSVVLECLYELEGDQLYSVKWYKDNDEFFRFVPKDFPPAQTFKLAGVTVNEQNSSSTSVLLENIELTSSGKYRCEVSAEAPSFTTVELMKEMTVYDVPDDGPQITGSLSQYNVGDTVHVNCTAIRSKPAASLEWHINGDKANNDLLRKYPIIIDQEGLETSILGLEFQVEQHHFSNGDLKLSCTASISYIYQKYDEKAILGDKLRASLLESKDEGKSLVKVNCAIGSITQVSCLHLSIAIFSTILLWR